MQNDVLDLGNGWKAFEAGEFYCKEKMEQLCFDCRFVRLGSPCADCEKKLSPVLLNQRGGGILAKYFVEQLRKHIKLELYNVHIKAAPFGSHHRYYCEHCHDVLRGKGHHSLDTSQELFDHLLQYHHIHVKFYFWFAQKWEHSFRNQHRSIVVRCAWKTGI